MSRAFALPDLGEGLTEAQIVRVLVREGDVIGEDTPLLEVETDKAQVEIPSPLAGRVEKIHVEPGQTVKVGEVLVTFADGAGARPGAAALGAPARPAAAGGPVPAAPATRRLARELGVDLRAVEGTGPGGRVTDADVRGAGRAARPLAEGPPAVATDRGLIVPVLRDVDRTPVLELARALGALAQRVRDGKATLDDLRGGTFTVTNIGALGGTGAIPIINYPEVAILGVARAREEPVVRDGHVVPRLLLPLSLTFDHRVADGADGARFAADIVRRLEHPDQLLLEL